MGSGCCSVGRAVASDTRDPRFESSRWQNLYWIFVYCELYWNDENKEKEAGNCPFLQMFELFHFPFLRTNCCEQLSKKWLIKFCVSEKNVKIFWSVSKDFFGRLLQSDKMQNAVLLLSLKTASSTSQGGNSLITTSLSTRWLLTQCDQMATLFSNIWPFTSMKTCPLGFKFAKVSPKICQSWFPNMK